MIEITQPENPTVMPQEDAYSSIPITTAVDIFISPKVDSIAGNEEYLSLGGISHAIITDSTDAVQETEKGESAVGLLGEVQARAKIVDSINMVESHLVDLDMGENTKSTLSAVLHELAVNKGLVTVTSDGIEATFSGTMGKPLESRLKIDRLMLAVRVPEFVTQLNKLGVEISEEDAIDFVYDWNIAHELGHGYSMPTESPQSVLRKPWKTVVKDL